MARLFADTPTSTTSSTGSSSLGALVVRSDGNTTGSQSYIEFTTADGNSRTAFIRVNNPSFTANTITGVGNANVLFSGNVTAFNSSVPSDIRLKENVKDIENSLEKVLNIRGVTYNYKKQENNKVYIGVIAQEIEKILPEVVSESYNPSEIDSEDKIKTVSYIEIVPVLIEAIKEQNKIIEDLKSRIEILEQN